MIEIRRRYFYSSGKLGGSRRVDRGERVGRSTVHCGLGG